jgi:hypothetical protein
MSDVSEEYSDSIDAYGTDRIPSVDADAELMQAQLMRVSMSPFASFPEFKRYRILWRYFEPRFIRIGQLDVFADAEI